jgi:hypothetical protein
LHQWPIATPALAECLDLVARLHKQVAEALNVIVSAKEEDALGASLDDAVQPDLHASFVVRYP